MSITFHAARLNMLDPEYPNGIWVNYGKGKDLNLSNANALELLARLGYDDDGYYCGSLEIHELQRRIIKARNSKAQAAHWTDDGRDTTEEIGALGCRMVTLGQPAGYWDARMDSLSAIAAEGLERGYTHVSYS